MVIYIYIIVKKIEINFKKPGHGWLLCLPLSNHSRLCKKLNWYDDAMSSVVKLRSAEYLSSIPILSTLDLSLFRQKMFIKVLVKGQSPSTKEEDEASNNTTAFNYFSIVIAGSLSLSVSLADGTRKELRKLSMGSTFNEKYLSNIVVPPSPSLASTGGLETIPFPYKVECRCCQAKNCCW